jgi:hypothetical protein
MVALAWRDETMGKLLHMPVIPPAAAGHLLNRHSPGEIAQAIDVLMDLLDCLCGDPDLEDDDPAEDDDPLEQDDPTEDDDSDHCAAGEDWMIGGAAVPGHCGGVGTSCHADDEDTEVEQMADDVPSLPIYDVRMPPSKRN